VYVCNPSWVSIDYRIRLCIWRYPWQLAGCVSALLHMHPVTRPLDADYKVGCVEAARVIFVRGSILGVTSLKKVAAISSLSLILLLPFMCANARVGRYSSWKKDRQTSLFKACELLASTESSFQVLQRTFRGPFIYSPNPCHNGLHAAGLGAHVTIRYGIYSASFFLRDLANPTPSMRPTNSWQKSKILQTL
jgi:hypothetical protein